MATESGSRLEHCSDVEVLTHLSYPLAKAYYMWKKSYRMLLCFIVIVIVIV